ncbi:11328_t:CDS:2 [Gigaspora margarita]|uniref:11328_t:CDS:1 n=1 Tax=Gigaspora margarita TaxID=4874 RepID=A0ABN7UZP0_GIGMA|nr:11328_t:CDS:2 [Gigaspora margarita]
MENPMGCMARLIIMLQEYDFKIKHHAVVQRSKVNIILEAIHKNAIGEHLEKRAMANNITK